MMSLTFDLAGTTKTTTHGLRRRGGDPRPDVVATRSRRPLRRPERGERREARRGPVNNTRLSRAVASLGSGLATRCTQLRKIPFVKIWIWSPALTVRAPGTGVHGTNTEFSREPRRSSGASP